MKKFYLLGLPILTLVLAGCFHVKPEVTSQPPQEETATETNMKTYSHLEYGFSFTYPKDWIVQNWPYPRESNATEDIVVLSAPPPPAEGEYLPPLSIKVYKSVQKLDDADLKMTSVKDYLEKYSAMPFPGTDGIYFSNVQMAVVGNKNGWSATVQDIGGGTHYFVELNNGSVVEIGHPEFFGDPEDIIVSKILASFVFPPLALGGDPSRCTTSQDCYSGYECRYEEAFGGKVCLPQ